MRFWREHDGILTYPNNGLNRRLHRILRPVATLAKHRPPNSPTQASTRIFFTSPAFKCPFTKGAATVASSSTPLTCHQTMPALLCATARTARYIANLHEVPPGGGGSNANISPEILRNSIRIDDKSPRLFLLLYFRVQKAYYTRSR